MSQFISVQLTKEAQRLLRQAERALEPRVLFGLIFELFDKLGPKAAGHVTKKTLAGQVLHRRTGELARAMFGKAEMVHGIPAIRVGVFRGPSTRYAGAQEWGATIRPKHA